MASNDVARFAAAEATTTLQ
jgi:hypothetical protein